MLGWAAFGGLRMAVAPGVFVPRGRTELLAELAAGLARPGAVVLDLCCGTGAVAAVVADRVPDVELYAADIDPAAVACARTNLAPYGGVVLAGDLYAALPATLRGRVEVLVANAPYVPTGAIALMPREARLHEADVALDGGADGLAVLTRVVAGASPWLTPTGHLLFETSRAQAPTAAATVAAAGLVPEIRHDEDREATVVLGHR
ncbi:MAG: Methytransferase [Friedmanniella sp.]|nr:Methytransferase [Friedmanniella sp.]